MSFYLSIFFYLFISVEIENNSIDLFLYCRAGLPLHFGRKQSGNILLVPMNSLVFFLVNYTPSLEWIRREGEGARVLDKNYFLLKGARKPPHFGRNHTLIWGPDGAALLGKHPIRLLSIEKFLCIDIGAEFG